MKKHFFFLFPPFFSACATEPPLPTLAVIPTQAIKPTDAPNDHANGVADNRASTHNRASATTPAQPAVAAPLKGEVTLWHTYEANGVEEKLFADH